MANFGRRSIEQLETCHKDIQYVLNQVIIYYDFSVREGSRELETQQKYYRDGYSKCDGIEKKSKHQVDESTPLSMAVDICPYPSLYSDENEFKRLAKFVYREAQVALKNGDISHSIEWGGTWKTFKDLPHWEIIPIL